MENQLTGYRPPTVEEVAYLWANSLIVLDTNCLFIPYRAKQDTFNRFFHTLESFTERLWLPHQVVSEYRKNRPNVIIEQKAAYQAIITTLKSNESKITGDISKYSRHSSIDTEKIKQQLGKTFTEIVDDLNRTESQYPDFESTDPILDRISILFNGKVGPEYSAERIQEIFNEGKVRYQSETPPGFEDKDKKTDLELYGDLIIWYQMIDQAKLTQKPIIFVTNDEKKDWWWIIKGKTLGPNPDLIREMKAKAGVSFHMYNPERFLQYAQEFLHQKVDHSAIAEIRDIRMEGSIEEAKRDKDVRIEANKDSFVIGHSVSFAGFSFTGDAFVRLVIFGPGKYVEGVEIAKPSVTKTHRWIFTWEPGFEILPGHYTALVYDTEKKVSDEVTVTAQKGAITIVARGDQSYYIGEEIKFSGTSTSSYYVFLTIVGPVPNKIARKVDSLTNSKDDDESSFVRVDVMGDNTWSYIWDTSKVGMSLKAGIYTIYAIEKPITPDNIGEKVFGTVSIIIKKPIVSATVSQSTYAKGDTIYITGTAEGTPREKVQIWLFHDSFLHHEIIRSNADASFMLKLPSVITKKFPEGTYYGIIQHPMENNEFDVYPDNVKKNVLTNIPTKATHIFSLDGPSGLKGDKAAGALISAINSPDIDDTYTQIMFVIENPVIRFDTIGNKRVGDKFTITAQTNLAVDDEIMIALFPFSKKSVQKADEEQFSGATGVIRVVKGDSGMNKIAFDVDISGFKSGEYIVRASAISIDAVGETKFRIT